MTIVAASALAAATLASIELVRTSRIFPAFRALSAHGRRSARLLTRTGVSEWAKERALRLASARMFAQSFRAGTALALVSAPWAMLVLVDRLWPFGLAVAWHSPATRWTLLPVSLLYAWGRRRIPSGERALQALALGRRGVLEASFDAECAVFGRAAAALPPAPPVFVAGLARAGTSIVVRSLFASGRFATLSYRDLPFALAPNLWARVSRHWRREIAASERGHGDGLLHDLDSPEAIEELFWRTTEGRRYCLPTRLLPHAPDAATIRAFRTYVGLVRLRHGGGRYLSKNNANILRLPALVEAFPDAWLVHPFRDPLAQAGSLLSQHRRALGLAAADPFRARFMRWLGHHDFGADHRPIDFAGDARAEPRPDHIDHWLRQWIAAYRFLLEQPLPVRDRQLFVDYDALCRTPDIGAARLETTLGTGPLALSRSLRSPTRYAPAPADPDLVAAAVDLHAQLVAMAAAPDRRRAPSIMPPLDRRALLPVD